MKIRNMYKDGEKVRKTDRLCKRLENGIEDIFDDMMLEGGVSIPTKRDCSFKVGEVRLSQEYVDKKGYNVSSFSGRRGRYLSWDQWVDLNDKVNDLFDINGVKADITSLGGKFVIREKDDGRQTERDWSGVKHENVGSMMNPVPRYRAWVPE